MGLFNKFRKNQANTNYYPQYADPMEAQFWQLYADSLLLKDRGALKSALLKREEACQKYAFNQGFKGMGYHHLAILTMYHLGNGQAAAKYARDSLSCGDEYYRCSQEHLAELQFGAHLESLQTAAMTSSTYDEALDYIQQGETLYGDVFITKRKELEEFRRDYPRFSDYQRQTSLLYYSRVSAELDQGDYAPAMSLLQLMLDRSEEPSYDLSYEEYVDILDDYGTISAMYLMKKARILGGSPEYFAHELAFIADEPLERIANFLPDCEPGDKEKFQNIVKALGNFPGVQSSKAFLMCKSKIE